MSQQDILIEEPASVSYSASNKTATFIMKNGDQHKFTEAYDNWTDIETYAINCSKENWAIVAKELYKRHIHLELFKDPIKIHIPGLQQDLLETFKCLAIGNIKQLVPKMLAVFVTDEPHIFKVSYEPDDRTYLLFTVNPKTAEIEAIRFIDTNGGRNALLDEKEDLMHATTTLMVLLNLDRPSKIISIELNTLSALTSLIPVGFCLCRISPDIYKIALTEKDETYIEITTLLYSEVIIGLKLILPGDQDALFITDIEKWDHVLNYLCNAK